jgi:uncharacterized delta-60 repeat protein
MYLERRQLSLFNTNVKPRAAFSTTILCTAVQPDGKILAGGNFIFYSGELSRNRLVRLNLDGTLDTAFCANATDGAKFDANINTVTVQSDGKILVGGLFFDYAGTTGRSRLIRLNSDGTLDTAFCANATDGTKFSATVNAITVRPDDKILVGGAFVDYSTITKRNYLIYLDSSGIIDIATTSAASDGNTIAVLTGTGSASSVVTQSDGKILVGGNFTSYKNTPNRNYLVRLNADGTPDTAFCANAVDSAAFSNVVNKITIQSDGKILVGGIFGTYKGVTGRARLIRLNSDGTLDTAFCTNAVDASKFSVGGVFDIVVQSDGKILVGGSFTAYAGTTGRNYLIRLNSDGTLDTAFCTNAVDSSKFNSTINTIAVQSDGKILVGGNFNNYGATLGRSYLVRFTSAGVLDTAFCANATDGTIFSNTVAYVSLQTDGKILICGVFSAYRVFQRNYFIRLNSDGTLDTAFCANASDGAKFSTSVNTIAVQSDGKILVGGTFLAYGGTTGRNSFIRLNSDGTLDTAFCANATDGARFVNSGNVAYINVQSNNRILIGGSFVGYRLTKSSAYFSHIASLNSYGIIK